MTHDWEIRVTWRKDSGFGFKLDMWRALTPSEFRNVIRYAGQIIADLDAEPTARPPDDWDADQISYRGLGPTALTDAEIEEAMCHSPEGGFVVT